MALQRGRAFELESVQGHEVQTPPGPRHRLSLSRSPALEAVKPGTGSGGRMRR